MNLQLASTEEYIDGQFTGNLGEVLIRCALRSVTRRPRAAGVARAACGAGLAVCTLPARAAAGAAVAAAVAAARAAKPPLLLLTRCCSPPSARCRRRCNNVLYLRWAV